MMMITTPEVGSTTITEEALASMAKQQHQTNGCPVPVLYVERQHASAVKKQLAAQDLLDTNCRMGPADAENGQIVVECHTLYVDLRETPESTWIAIPHTMEEWRLDDDYNKELSGSEWWRDMVLAAGVQFCAYSTKVLGNGNVAVSKRQTTSSSSSEQAQNLSLVEQVLLDGVEINAPLYQRVRELDCIPRQRLERFGDDRAILLPASAFQGDDFVELLCETWRTKHSNGDNPLPSNDEILQDVWKRLASAHRTSNEPPRIIRKGTIDPNSKIRHSGHQLLYPVDGNPDTTGPGSSGWICVTENGIRQSFDLTRVMFSRGNISEKIRFAKLVQEGEVVLDMYAGIGYYTLPAAIHGKAAKVYACEWNEDALTALRYNVQDNKVAGKVEILAGDCRRVAVENKLVNLVDRISLGLLPSSEGGWRTAIRALKDDKGGWMHVHGNVPGKEKDAWTMWLCRQLYNLTREEKQGEWQVLCTHVERVKSFAPTVFHYVADIFVGPGAGLVVVVQKDGTFSHCPENLPPPSCALSEDGVLHQEWMR